MKEKNKLVSLPNWTKILLFICNPTDKKEIFISSMSRKLGITFSYGSFTVMQLEKVGLVIRLKKGSKAIITPTEQGKKLSKHLEEIEKWVKIKIQ